MVKAEEILSALPLTYFCIDFMEKVIATNDDGLLKCKDLHGVLTVKDCSTYYPAILSAHLKNDTASFQINDERGAPLMKLDIRPWEAGSLLFFTGLNDHQREFASNTPALAERFLQPALDALDDYVYAFDSNCRFIYVNRAMRALYGLDVDPLGKTLSELEYPRELAAELNGHIRKIFETGCSVKDEVYFKSRTGFAAYFDFIYQPVFNGQGQVDYVMGVSRDSTLRKSLQQQISTQQAVLSGIFELLPVGVAVAEKNGKMILENRHWHDNLLQLLAGPDGKRLKKILTGESLPAFSANHEGRQDAEFNYTDGSGRERWMKLAIAEIANDQQAFRHRVMVLQDISELKNMLKATFDSVDEMIQVFQASRNEQGEIIDFSWVLNNRRSEDIYGDVIGKSLIHQHPGVIQTGIFNNLKAVVLHGKPMDYEVRYSGEQFDGWYHQSVVKLGDGVVTTTKDITTRKLQQEQLETSYLLLAQSEAVALTGSWSFDISSRNFHASAGFYNLLSLAADSEPELEIFYDLAVAKSKKAARAFIDALYDGKACPEVSLDLLVSGRTKRHLIKASLKAEKSAVDASGRIYGVNMDISVTHALSQNNARLLKQSYELREKQRAERLRATLNAQEEERARIADDLHHGLCQSLYAVALKLDQFEKSADQCTGGIFGEIFRQAQALIQETISECRRISHQLSPAILQEYGLRRAIEKLCENLPHALSCTAIVNEVPAWIPLFYQTFIYRTAQELLMNAIKHGQANHILIELDVEDDAFSLSVRDNGRGFKHKNRRLGLGLTAIKAKLKLLNGVIGINSSPGNTLVTVKIPLK